MAQPTIVEETVSRLVIEIEPTVAELRARTGRLSALTSLLFVVLVGLGWGIQRSVTGGSGMAVPLAVGAALSAFFLLVRMRRMTTRESLVLDRDAGTIEFRSGVVPRRRLPPAVALGSATGARVVEGATDYSRQSVLDLGAGSPVPCFSLHGRRIPDDERARVDARLRQVVSRMSAFLARE